MYRKPLLFTFIMLFLVGHVGAFYLLGYCCRQFVMLQVILYVTVWECIMKCYKLLHDDTMHSLLSCCRWFCMWQCENASWSVTSYFTMIPCTRCSQCSFWVKYSLFAINFVVWVSCCFIIATRDAWYHVRALALVFILIFNSVVVDSESTTESADSSRVCPRPNPQIFCGRKWRFWFVCSQVNIYLSGGGVQETLHNCVWPPVRPCTRHRRSPSPTPRCLVGHTCLGTHHFAASNNYLKR